MKLANSNPENKTNGKQPAANSRQPKKPLKSNFQSWMIFLGSVLLAVIASIWIGVSGDVISFPVAQFFILCLSSLKAAKEFCLKSRNGLFSSEHQYYKTVLCGVCLMAVLEVVSILLSPRPV